MRGLAIGATLALLLSGCAVPIAGAPIAAPDTRLRDAATDCKVDQYLASGDHLITFNNVAQDEGKGLACLLVLLEMPSDTRAKWARELIQWNGEKRAEWSVFKIAGSMKFDPPGGLFVTVTQL